MQIAYRQKYFYKVAFSVQEYFVCLGYFVKNFALSFREEKLPEKQMSLWPWRPAFFLAHPLTESVCTKCCYVRTNAALSQAVFAAVTTRFLAFTLLLTADRASDHRPQISCFSYARAHQWGFFGLFLGPPFSPKLCLWPAKLCNSKCCDPRLCLTLWVRYQRVQIRTKIMIKDSFVSLTVSLPKS